MPPLFRRNVALRRRPPFWVDLTPPGFEFDAGHTQTGHGDGPGNVAALTHDEVRLNALVLEARNIPCRTRRRPGGWSVQVRRMDAGRAGRELRLWREENRDRPAPPPPPPLPGIDHILPPALYCLGLAAFHAFANQAHPSLELYPLRLVELGSANAAAVLSGEWWRLVTALTLHGDGPHLLGNMVVGTLFASLVCRRLGCGLAMLLAVLGGVLGNLCNALVMGPPHDSIGFSTAVFAGAGLLAGQGILSGPGGLLRSLVPVGAGMGLLAMLGAGGENTDLGAHLFGFGSGLALGLPALALVRRTGVPPRVVGALCWTLAAALPAAAWALALGGW